MQANDNSPLPRLESFMLLPEMVLRRRYSARGISTSGGFELAVSMARLAGPPEQFAIEAQ